MVRIFSVLMYLYIETRSIRIFVNQTITLPLLKTDRFVSLCEDFDEIFADTFKLTRIVILKQVYYWFLRSFICFFLIAKLLSTSLVAFRATDWWIVCFLTSSEIILCITRTSSTYYLFWNKGWMEQQRQHLLIAIRKLWRAA